MELKRTRASIHRLGGQGRGHGTRWVSGASLGFWFLLEFGVGSRLGA